MYWKDDNSEKCQAGPKCLMSCWNIAPRAWCAVGPGCLWWKPYHQPGSPKTHHFISAAVLRRICTMPTAISGNCSCWETWHQNVRLAPHFLMLLTFSSAAKVSVQHCRKFLCEQRICSFNSLFLLRVVCLRCFDFTLLLTIYDPIRRLCPFRINYMAGTGASCVKHYICFFHFPSADPDLPWSRELGN